MVAKMSSLIADSKYKSLAEIRCDQGYGVNVEL